MFTGISSTLPLREGGPLESARRLERKRVPILPDVPAVNEEIAGYEVNTWYGMFAPVQLPRPQVVKLNQTLAKIFATPDARQRLSRARRGARDNVARAVRAGSAQGNREMGQSHQRVRRAPGIGCGKIDTL